MESSHVILDLDAQGAYLDMSRDLAAARMEVDELRGLVLEAHEAVLWRDSPRRAGDFSRALRELDASMRWCPPGPPGDD